MSHIITTLFSPLQKVWILVEQMYLNPPDGWEGEPYHCDFCGGEGLIVGKNSETRKCPACNAETSHWCQRMVVAGPFIVNEIRECAPDTEQGEPSIRYRLSAMPKLYRSEELNSRAETAQAEADRVNALPNWRNR